MALSRRAALSLMCMFLLCIQNSAHSLTLRYSRGVLKERYNMSVAIVMMELVKVLACAFIIKSGIAKWLEGPTDIEAASTTSSSSSAGVELDALGNVRLWQLLKSEPRMVVPALLYFVQNIITFYALENLEASTYAVLGQTKLITSALFSVAMLGRRLSSTMWRALFLLFLGVCLVSIDQAANSRASSPVECESAIVARPGIIVVDDPSASGPRGNFVTGLAAAAMIVTISGFAGVYFEMLLKQNKQRVSVFERNFQLGVYSLALGVFTLVVNEAQDINTNGLLHDFSFVSWLSILIGALGGLLVAFVVKFGDTIVKGFATGLAMITTALVSSFAFSTPLTSTFFIAVGVVVISIFDYSEASTAAPTQGAAAISATHATTTTGTTTAATMIGAGASSSSSSSSRCVELSQLERGFAK